MAKKDDLRKQLEDGVAVFLSQGKQITRLPMYGKKRKLTLKQEEVETVEIEVEHLPESLQKKYFGDN